MKHIAFFLSAQNLNETYTKPALELVNLLISEKYGFVYGASDMGLMKLASDEAKKVKGYITGVSCEEFREVACKEADELIVCKNISERKRTLFDKSDAFIAVPGGAGTLDEITEMIDGRKLGHHDKPIVLFNINSFWDGLIEQYDRMITDGFIKRSRDEIFYVSSNPQEILSYLQGALR
jgi:hypothetical protein